MVIMGAEIAATLIGKTLAAGGVIIAGTPVDAWAERWAGTHWP